VQLELILPRVMLEQQVGGRLAAREVTLGRSPDVWAMTRRQRARQKTGHKIVLIDVTG
jgi:hypothetical protein